MEKIETEISSNFKLYPPFLIHIPSGEHTAVSVTLISTKPRMQHILWELLSLLEKPAEQLSCGDEFGVVLCPLKWKHHNGWFLFSL